MPAAFDTNEMLLAAAVLQRARAIFEATTKFAPGEARENEWSTACAFHIGEAMAEIQQAADLVRDVGFSG